MPLKILIALAMVNKSHVKKRRGSLSSVQGFTSLTCRTAWSCTCILYVLVAWFKFRALTLVKPAAEVKACVKLQNIWMEGSSLTGSCWNPTVTTVTVVRSFTTYLLMQISSKLDLGAALGEPHYFLLTIPTFPSGRFMNYTVIIFLPKSSLFKMQTGKSVLCPSVFWLCNRVPRDRL